MRGRLLGLAGAVGFFLKRFSLGFALLLYDFGIASRGLFGRVGGVFEFVGAIFELFFASLLLLGIAGGEGKGGNGEDDEGFHFTTESAQTVLEVA